MLEEDPDKWRFLRHRTADKFAERDPNGRLIAADSDAAAIDELARGVEQVHQFDYDDGAVPLSTVLLIDCPDGQPIAYSPPHRFGRFWVVPRLWLVREGRAWTALAPYPGAAHSRPHHVLRINRGQRISTLERDDCPMLVIAPPHSLIDAVGGVSEREEDFISLD